MDTFAQAFRALTGNDPFPWQRDLYENHFAQGKFPDACTLPTGLGKTSVVAVWLLALATNPTKVPRRLVYVVNRRTVVDQTTAEVEKYAAPLAFNAPPIHPALLDLSAQLRALCSDPTAPPLALSTLRGQFADNREWSGDPARPAVVVGTVDMIGSRLLFSGYGLGMRTRPLHAGFLGQDALLVHDEAHLEPAFQTLVEAIRDEQRRRSEVKSFHVMELTATSRGGKDVFPNNEERAANEADPTVQLRIGAKKAIEFFPVGDEKAGLVKEVVARAGQRAEGNAAVVVFVRSVERAGEIAAQLGKAFPKAVEELNGTLRGYERDQLIKKSGFKRFLPGASGEHQSPAFLVCTSAGEVGVNISADHLVCDLSTFDSMAQRFGRVNRFGEPADRVARIDVVYPKEFPAEDKLDDSDRRRKRTLEVLRRLNGDGSPRALREAHQRALNEGSGTEPMTTDKTQALREYILSTYAPPPTILPTSDILFDAWALTTPKELPGRPPVAEYLHGVEDETQAETHVAWREEAQLFDGTQVTQKQIGEWLEDYPLRPHELLRDVTWRVQDELAELAGDEARAKLPVWVVAPDDSVAVITLDELARKDAKKKYVVNLAGRIVVLPPKAGGLTTTGTLSGDEGHSETRSYDVAGLVPQPSGVPLVRLAVKAGEDEWVYKLVASVVGLTQEWELTKEPPESRGKEAKDIRDECKRVGLPAMRVKYRLDLRDTDEAGDEAFAYLVLAPEPKADEPKYPAAWPALDAHNAGVKGFADAICTALKLPPGETGAVSRAAGWHDLGKDRAVWQRGAGNRSGFEPVAKTLHGRPPENLNGFRHELASLSDIRFDPAYRSAFDAEPGPCQELLQHLVAAHHGRGRPHFRDGETTDPDRPVVWAESVVRATPGRYARLQRQYGRWGLAYLESLVRAADVLDSKRIDETPVPDQAPSESCSRPRPPFVAPAATPLPEPTIRVTVDPTNPGQFFACCGLLEIADRLWEHDTEGWFAENGREFRVTADGTLRELLDALVAAKLEPLDPDDGATSPLRLPLPRPLVLDWWHDDRAGGGELKTWAGRQQVVVIARAMQAAVARAAERGAELLNFGELLPDPENPQKTVAPLYFDARRASGATNLDVGFSLDVQGFDAPTHPAVEFLCLIGLQRFRPSPAGDGYAYRLWTDPHPPATAAALASGAVALPGSRGYTFRLLYRTKYLKGFLPALPSRGD